MNVIGWKDESEDDSIGEVLLIARMRLILAAGTLLNVIIDPTGFGHPDPSALILVFVYTVQSFGVCFLSDKHTRLRESKLVHWLDVFWFSLLLVLTGPLTPFFFLLFFAISTAAFRCGYDEGARTTLACAALYCLASIRATNEAMVASVMLRTAFLLGLGYMVAHWADVLLKHKRQIALLRAVSQVSNPRFGVDHTISSVLAQTREHFQATSCIVLTPSHDVNTWSLRSDTEGEGLFATGHYVLDAELASPLLSLPPQFNATYCSPLLPFLPWQEEFFTRDTASSQWQKACVREGRRLADLLGARSFISVTVALHGEQGTMVVIAPKATLCRSDASFLAQIAAQAFPVIDNIHLLDTMATQAAWRERQKFSTDLHDTTLQPYIGLSHALTALLCKTRTDNPIAAELRQVADMANCFIRDLRHFSKELATSAPTADEPAFVVALRTHAANVKEHFDLDIALSGLESLAIKDRLGAEIFHLISEGMSNIRRHTFARRGSVELSCNQGWLRIQISNESRDGPAALFVPRSISQRAALLGGGAHVTLLDSGTTVVNIDIPV